MNINKLLHSPNVAGQSLVDRVTAAKHSLAGERLAKFVCKATTEEQIPPKKKHIDREFLIRDIFWSTTTTFLVMAVVLLSLVVIVACRTAVHVYYTHCCLWCAIK